jgi:hypothetical protein
MRNCSVVSWKEFKADRSIVADGIFLCCVMHTIPTLDLRRRAVAANLRRLREEGVVVVITPRHDSKYTTTAIANAVVFEDGIVRLYGDGTFTFYRNYTKSELIEFLGQVGLQPVEEIHSSHRIIVVAERKRRSRQGSL